jgi:hypothetical protein
MFKRIRYLLAITAIFFTILCGSRVSNATIHHFVFDFNLFFERQGVSMAHDRYLGMMRFLRTGGGLNSTTQRSYSIPVTPIISQDLLRIELAGNLCFPVSIYVFVNPVNLYIIGFATGYSVSRFLL